METKAPSPSEIKPQDSANRKPRKPNNHNDEALYSSDSEDSYEMDCFDVYGGTLFDNQSRSSKGKEREVESTESIRSPDVLKTPMPSQILEACDQQVGALKSADSGQTSLPWQIPVSTIPLRSSVTAAIRKGETATRASKWREDDQRQILNMTSGRSEDIYTNTLKAEMSTPVVSSSSYVYGLPSQRLGTERPGIHQILGGTSCSPRHEQVRTLEAEIRQLKGEVSQRYRMLERERHLSVRATKLQEQLIQELYKQDSLIKTLEEKEKLLRAVIDVLKPPLAALRKSPESDQQSQDLKEHHADIHKFIDQFLDEHDRTSELATDGCPLTAQRTNARGAFQELQRRLVGNRSPNRSHRAPTQAPRTAEAKYNMEDRPPLSTYLPSSSSRVTPLRDPTIRHLKKAVPKNPRENDKVLIVHSTEEKAED